MREGLGTLVFVVGGCIDFCFLHWLRLIHEIGALFLCSDENRPRQTKRIDDIGRTIKTQHSQRG